MKPAGVGDERALSGAESSSPREKFVIAGGDLGYLVRFRSDLIEALIRAGWQVTVITPDASTEGVARLRALGADHHQIKLSRTGMNPIQDALNLFSLFKWLRNTRPSRFFAYGAKPITIGISAAALAGIRRRYAMLAGLGYGFVTVGSASTKRRIVRASQQLAYRILFVGCRSVVFHNQDDRDLMVDSGIVRQDRTYVVPGSGVPLDYFTATEAPTNPVRFMFVGRLLRSKGVIELLEAAKLLRLQYPQAEVHIVGGNDANPESVDAELLEVAQDAGDVVLHGHVDDVRPLLATASVFVLPSYREGLPRSALEAMASGRTVITTNAPGCRDVVSPGDYGALVPVRDPVALAAVMSAYAGDPARIIREGHAARNAVAERFDVKQVTATMLKALEVVP